MSSRWDIQQEVRLRYTVRKWEQLSIMPLFRLLDGKECIVGYASSDRLQHTLSLLKEKGLPDGSFAPFGVSVHVESGATGRIVPELSRKIFCTEKNSRDICRDEKFAWCIWTKLASEVERWDPESRRDSHLRFVVVITQGPTTSIETKTRTSTAICPSTISCLSSLSQDFLKMLEDAGSNPNVTFKCGGQSIAAHAAVVCARSPIMAAMLSKDNWVEGKTRVVNIPNMESDVFQYFIRYLYSAQMPPELTVELALCLYEVGDQYAVLELVMRCSKFLLQHLTVDNACSVLVTADAHSDKYLKEAVVRFMVEVKVPRVFGGWLEFCSSHCKLANEVLNQIYNAVADS